MEVTSQLGRKPERKNKRSILTFLVFLAMSTALWLLIKLSEDYTTQTLFGVTIVDVPAEKWLASDAPTVKLSLDINGFHTLRLTTIREGKRNVTLSLADVPYRLENGNTYSFSSQYVAEKVADLLGVNASDITMNDAKVYFNLVPLKSKPVPVELQADIKAARQYGVYGIPILDPAMVTVFGPEDVIDTVRTVKTELLTLSNASESFSAMVPLLLRDGQVQCATKEVKASIRVEKFTETEVMVPIALPDTLRLRLFPDAMTVKCLVAIKDFGSLTPDNFSAVFDAQQFEARQPLLDVRLTAWPQTVQVIETKPNKVEYIIVQ
ncbi:MAG: YbbR-like domain-containing protein [Bacteroidales bacterium]|nr:YbbR-like domain-containing protein [Bacteroidales bacterium]